MSEGFNLPHGAQDGDRLDAKLQRCCNGHEWDAAMLYELGGWYYMDEQGDECPECGEYSDG